MRDEAATLEIEYEMNADFARRAWFAEFRKRLPSTLAFWGTIIFLGLLAMFYYRQSAREFVFFSMVVGVVLAVLSYIYYSSYSQRKMMINVNSRVKKADVSPDAIRYDTRDELLKPSLFVFNHCRITFITG
jgi:hypothetical protein